MSDPTPASSAPTVDDVRRDLIDEQEALDSALDGLPASAWTLATSSPGWSVADQIAHLSYFDDTAALAIAKPEAFAAHVGTILELLSGGGSGETIDDVTLGSYRNMPPDELLMSWRAHRRRLADASAGLSDTDRVAWYGPSMGAKSFLTARLMECWAHGQDILDAVGRTIPASTRLSHIVRLGVITRGWAYVNRKLEVPDVDVAVLLAAPDGGEWNYGNQSASQSVVGSAEDFCLVVTQRRHVDDTNLVVTGAEAREWMEIAQAFAGPATNGPAAKKS